jgi:hypothetical protein
MKKYSVVLTCKMHLLDTESHSQYGIVRYFDRDYNQIFTLNSYETI